MRSGPRSRRAPKAAKVPGDARRGRAVPRPVPPADRARLRSRRKLGSADTRRAVDEQRVRADRDFEPPPAGRRPTAARPAEGVERPPAARLRRAGGPPAARLRRAGAGRSGALGVAWAGVIARTGASRPFELAATDLSLEAHPRRRSSSSWPNGARRRRRRRGPRRPASTCTAASSTRCFSRRRGPPLLRPTLARRRANVGSASGQRWPQGAPRAPRTTGRGSPGRAPC